MTFKVGSDVWSLSSAGSHSRLLIHLKLCLRLWFVTILEWIIIHQVMTTFMPPPPAASYLAFHPQDNNIIAIGMEDSTIQIYNVRVDEVNQLELALELH